MFPLFWGVDFLPWRQEFPEVFFDSFIVFPPLTRKQNSFFPWRSSPSRTNVSFFMASLLTGTVSNFFVFPLIQFSIHNLSPREIFYSFGSERTPF